MSDQLARRDRGIAEVAARQHGVISVDQLHRAGFTKHDVLHRVRTGRLHRIHRGVYAVGHPAISREGRWMAAVLACGQATATPKGAEIDLDLERRETVLDRWGATVSHRSAAVLWGLLPMTNAPVDVSVPGGGGRARRRGIRLHRSSTLSPAAVILQQGIPVTTPARTVSDLQRTVSTGRRRGLISAKELRRAIRQADVLGLPLGDQVGGDRSRSDLERDFLRLCRRHRLPAPRVNTRVGPDLVDFLWPDRRLAVETDGYRYHRGRIAFEDDRERDLRLRAAGYDVMRISEKQVDEEPEQIAEVLTAALRVGQDARG